jgi:hypothetical protein
VPFEVCNQWWTEFFVFQSGLTVTGLSRVYCKYIPFSFQCSCHIHFGKMNLRFSRWKCKLYMVWSKTTCSLVRWLSMFARNLFPPSSGLKSKGFRPPKAEEKHNTTQKWS